MSAYGYLLLFFLLVSVVVMVFFFPNAVVLRGKKTVLPPGVWDAGSGTVIIEKLIADAIDIVEWCSSNELPDAVRAKRLKENWKSVSFEPIGPPELWRRTMDTIAFVTNKKEVFMMCVDNRDENTMRFVMIHELAHMMSESYGHDSEFGTNFSELLKIAVSLGKYSPVDYSRRNSKYCMFPITSSPLFPR